MAYNYYYCINERLPNFHPFPPFHIFRNLGFPRQYRDIHLAWHNEKCEKCGTFWHLWTGRCFLICVLKKGNETKSAKKKGPKCCSCVFHSQWLFVSFYLGVGGPRNYQQTKNLAVCFIRPNPHDIQVGSWFLESRSSTSCQRSALVQSTCRTSACRAAGLKGSHFSSSKEKSSSSSIQGL